MNVLELIEKLELIVADDYNEGYRDVRIPSPTGGDYTIDEVEILEGEFVVRLE